MFLLTYFIAAIKQQRGYDADEKLEAKSEWNCDGDNDTKRRRSRVYDEVE